MRELCKAQIHFRSSPDTAAQLIRVQGRRFSALSCSRHLHHPPRHKAPSLWDCDFWQVTPADQPRDDPHGLAFPGVINEVRANSHAARETDPMLRFHCTLHKCLTSYFQAVFANTFDKRGFAGSSFGNFIRKWPDYYLEHGAGHTASIINTAYIDPAGFDQDWRGSLTIRDPRDIVISGYYYHKKGGEAWCGRPWREHGEGAQPIWTYNTFDGDAFFPSDQSLMEHLNEVSLEDGLITEIKLRKKTFDTILSWIALDDDRMKISKYEDIMGDERAFFRGLGRHFELSRLRQEIMGHYGYKHAAGRLVSKRHVRDPSPRQWKKHFSPRVDRMFHDTFPGLVETLGYEV